MFDGVPADQLHQFIASSRTPPSLSFPLPFSSLHHQHHHQQHQQQQHHQGSSNTTNVFDLYSSQQGLLLQQQQQQQQQSQFLQQQQQQSLAVSQTTQKINDDDKDDSWSNDEVLALLRIRSSFENWFPEFTWEHVSRKLEELGYKKSAEKCKEKFEEESRCFSDNINYTKNCKFFNEIEDNSNIVSHHENKKMENQNQDQEKEKEEDDQEQEENLKVLNEDSRNDHDNQIKKPSSKGVMMKKKRKRSENFEIYFKGFCEDIVKKMMSQQEEMHNKLIEDMMKRDEEKFAREEAWKKQEMDRINQELENRAYQQSIASDRQATIVNFLQKFTSLSNPPQSSSSSSSLNIINLPQNPNSSTTTTNNNIDVIMPTSCENLAPKNPNLSPRTPKVVLAHNSSSLIDQDNQNPNSQNRVQVTSQNLVTSSNVVYKEDLGKRWPRDEVFALINLRCSLYNNGDHDHHKDQGGGGGGKVTPLWERISQGMLELGYKRSAKRCKEKWENINKYFRKTKDVNKKRSLDSRTCPYFHQLSTLYNQGKLVSPSSENRGTALPENQHGTTSSQGGGGGTTTTSSDSTMNVVAQCEKNLVHQASPFDFDEF